MPEAQNNTPSTVPAHKARQGVTSGSVRYVLGTSLALVMIGLAIAWLLV